MTQNDDLGKTQLSNAKMHLKESNIFIQTIKNTVCNIYKVYNDTTFVIIHTKQEVKKYLNNIKSRNNKKNDTLVKILNGTHYYEFLQKFEYSNKDELTNKINLITFESNKKQNIENDFKYGLKEEQKVLIKIKNFFINDEIIPCHNPYSTFDFIGLKSQYLYELKSNNDKFEDYPNAIMGINKVVKNYKKQIFLFGYKSRTDENDIYYFIKPPNFETKYNKRKIYLKNRDIYNWVYDIPRTELQKINKNEVCNLQIDLTENEIFSHLYLLDKVRADI